MAPDSRFACRFRGPSPAEGEHRRVRDVDRVTSKPERKEERPTLPSEKYRLISENTSDLIAMTTFSIQPKYTYASPSHKTVMGYEPEELIGKSGLEFVHPEDRKRLRPLLLDYVERKARRMLTKDGLDVTRRISYRARDKTGTWHHLESTVNVVGQELLFVSRDVTDRVQTVRALAESEETYRQLVENAPIGIYNNDLSGTFLYGNKKAEEIIGYQRSELTGKSFLELDLLGPKDLPRALKLLALNKLGRSTGPDEFVLRRKDGSRRNVEITTVVTSVGGRRAVLGMVQDTTERTRAQASLERQAAELRVSNRELQRFAHVAGHDLREPLRMVDSYLDLLRRKYAGKLEKEAGEYIAFAVDGAAAMRELLDGLLAYAQVGSEGLALAPTECETVYERAVRNLTVAIDESDAQISHDELPIVAGDEMQLVQVFQNLIGNAVKFRAGERPLLVHVGVEKKKTEWRFCVKDNGIGISPENRQRVFEIFHRLHTRAEYAGTGVGLAICSRVIERHGGRIWVDSKLGRGSTFYFSLPDIPVSSS